MKLIVGLGNPGIKYDQTRHNVGYMIIDEFLRRMDLSLKFDAKFNAEVLVTQLYGEKVCFMKPSTYMNLSGESITRALKYYEIDIQNMIVFVDDINLETGKLRLREKGSHGGHNGLRHIIGLLHSEDFKRIRIGIDHNHVIPLDRYVLGKFKDDELISIKHAISRSADMIEMFIKNVPYKDIMTKYNTQI